MFQSNEDYLVAWICCDNAIQKFIICMAAHNARESWGALSVGEGILRATIGAFKKCGKSPCRPDPNIMQLINHIA